MIDKLCPPAILYLGFSLTQIVIDTFKGFYNTAFFKTIVMVIFTLLLNILCKQGLSIISWLIVFIPFILMTYITAVLMFVFGLSPSSDNLDYDVKYPDDYPDELLIVRNPSNNTTVVNKTDNNNEEYDPNDLTSGTPEDINNYN
jgi:energy-coupling factor transporter transmembrane protein EcfT|tara:strand:- start:10949 stop:11380 length:432 start_codon:yes stop_codon:yes gene_type:complete